MAITPVAATNWAPAANGGTSAAIDTTGANLLVISAAWYGATTPVLTVSDAKGNTYTGLTVRDNATRQRIFYVLTPTVGAGHTFTLTGTNILPAFHAYAFAGVASYQTESGNVTIGTSGSVTPAANGALIVTGLVALTAAADAVAPPGFTLHQISYVASATVQGSAAYYVQPTAAAINPTWSWGAPGHTNVAVSTAVFLPALVTAVETVQPFVWGPL